MTPVVKIFQEIVERVNLSLMAELQTLEPTIEGIQYEHGHPREIVETLQQKDQSATYRFQKYPIIALFQDFPETNIGIGYQTEVNLNLIIAKGTRKDYKAKERYDYNFLPFLYPIYEELLKEIDRDKRIQTYGVQSIDHVKWDRLFWGRNGLFGNDSNIFSDYLDAIEIKNLKLKINLKLC
jgi:hypothetical protein